MLDRVSNYFLKILLFIVLSILFPFCTSFAQASARVEKFTGRAVSTEGNVEYVEYHTVIYEDGGVSESQTLYYDSKDEKIGELISEYSYGPRFGSYTFKDIRAQYKDGAKVTADQIRLFRKESPRADIEEKYLPRKENHIVGQGFHQFILKNLESISRGRIFHVLLVFPSRLDQYEFRIRKRKIEDDTLYIRLESDHWFLRLFAPHMDADYDINTHRLLRYQGISNLTDGSGKHKEVTITYSYES
jgi:hypothetical protein